MIGYDTPTYNSASVMKIKGRHLNVCSKQEPTVDKYHEIVNAKTVGSMTACIETVLVGK